MLRTGLSLRETARRLGVSLSNVQYNAKRMRAQGIDVPARQNKSWIADDQESRSVARARVAAGVADGTRCERCWLLKPCDHE